MAIVVNTIKAGNSELYNHFTAQDNLRKLIALYQNSQLECSRNGKVTPEVGSSREKDLVASLKSNTNLDVTYEIDTQEEEDVIIDGRKVSIKHSSNNRISNSGIKVVWTANKKRQKQFVKRFIFTNDLLIVWVRFNKNVVGKGKLEIVHISKDTIYRYHHLYQIQGKSPFKCLSGNSRGIEFNKQFFQTIVNNCDFRVHVSFNNQEAERMGPIEKRLQLLKII